MVVLVDFFEKFYIFAVLTDPFPTLFLAPCRIEQDLFNFIAPLLNKMYTDPHFLFGIKLCYVSKYQKKKNTSQQILDRGNLSSDMPLNYS